MRKPLAILAALLLSSSLGFAQNINRSLQGSQDPRGPVGLDTSNGAYFPGHINAFAGTAPTLTSCTGGSLSANAEDNAGQLTTGLQATCTLLFGTVFNAIPSCLLQTNATGITSTPTYTVTTSGINITAINSSSVYPYICIGNR